VQTRISKLVHTNELPCGINVIVAIATYTGFNQEDSILMNKSAVDRGMFQSTYYRTYREQNNKNHSTGEEEHFCKPVTDETKSMKPYNYDKLDDDGFVPENTFVESGDVIIGKCMPQKNGAIISNKDTSVFLKNNERAFVDQNSCNNKYFTNINGDGYTFCKVRLRSDRIPVIGDKFCLPPEAEVLTLNQGWKGIADIATTDWVAQLNPASGEVEYVNPSKRYQFYHDGLMYQATGQDLYVLSTMEHKMYVRKSQETEYRLVEAQQLLEEEATSFVYKAGCENGCSQICREECARFSDNYTLPLEDWMIVYASLLRSSVFDICTRTYTITPKSSMAQRLRDIYTKHPELGTIVASDGHTAERFVISHPDVFQKMYETQDYAELPIWAYECLDKETASCLWIAY
jgi:hypothetical protein